MRRALPLALVPAFAALAADARAALPRDKWDERELEKIRAASPHAVELLDQGEAAASAGTLEEAEGLFRRAHETYIDGALLWRRDCETLTELGRRREAVLACSTAVGQLHSGTNARALASALVDGPAHPSTGDLSMAVMLTAAERHRGLTLSVAAASCDIAERIGDVTMLQRCTESLEGFDPSDAATRHAQALLASRCPPWRFWAGWGALAAAVIATAGHALARALRGRSKVVRAAGVAAVLLGSLAVPRAAHAEDAPASTAPPPPGIKQPNGDNWLSKKWPIDDAHPDSNIPSEKERNADPLAFGYWLQDVALKGEHASKLGDHETAARFYMALTKAVPDRATGFVKACQEYEAAGLLEQAIEACGQALLRPGLVLRDYTHFIELVLSQQGPLSDKDKAALANVLAHMREDAASAGVIDELECEVGSRTSNVQQLTECVAALVKKAPDSPKTVVYQWNLAVALGHTLEAEKLVTRAQAVGVSADDLAKMKQATESHAMENAVRAILVAFALAFLAAAGALGRKAWLDRKTARAGSNGVGSLPPPADAKG
jgi:tetratricopeptide (TPR) repeat protein